MRRAIVGALAIASVGLGYTALQQYWGKPPPAAGFLRERSVRAALLPEQSSGEPAALRSASGSARSARAATPPEPRALRARQQQGPTEEEPSEGEQAEAVLAEEGAPARSGQAPAPVDMAEAERREAAMLERWYQDLEQRFEAQAVDGAWSRGTGASLKESFAVVNPANVTVSAVDCRGDMCKTTLAHAAEKLPSDFLSGFMPKMSPHVEHHFRYGARETTVYSIQQQPQAQ